MEINLHHLCAKICTGSLEHGQRKLLGRFWRIHELGESPREIQSLTIHPLFAGSLCQALPSQQRPCGQGKNKFLVQFPSPTEKSFGFTKLPLLFYAATHCLSLICSFPRLSFKTSKMVSSAVGTVKRAYLVEINLRVIHCSLVKQLIITK